MNIKQKLYGIKKDIRYTRYFNFFDPFTALPETKFLIYTRGRTGSSVFTDLLNCHPDIFCDYEIFGISGTKSGIKYPIIFIDSCSKRASLSAKKVYGFKLKIEQLRDDHGIYDVKSFFKKLNSRGWKFIYLKRTNSLLHKISGIISKETNKYHVKGEEDFSHMKFKIDCKLLMDTLYWGDELDKMEEDSLSGIPHLRIIYEDDLLDNAVHQQTSDRVFEYLGLQKFPVSTKYKKIIPPNLKDIILNYDEMKNSLVNTKYFEFLNV